MLNNQEEIVNKLIQLKERTESRLLSIENKLGSISMEIKSGNRPSQLERKIQNPFKTLEEFNEFDSKLLLTAGLKKDLVRLN